jgi:hypothetical protein
MELSEIVYKLTGKISPAGDSSVDNERYDNLKKICHLVEGLITDIDDMVFLNSDAKESSIKRSVEYGSKFLESITTRNQ